MILPNHEWIVLIQRNAGNALELSSIIGDILDEGAAQGVAALRTTEQAALAWSEACGWHVTEQRARQHIATLHANNTAIGIAVGTRSDGRADAWLISANHIALYPPEKKPEGWQKGRPRKRVQDA